MFPLIVSQVCRAWRDIAVATPRLWTILPVRCNPIAAQPVWGSDPVEEFTDQWLVRAGACPLSLILTAHVTAYRIRDVIYRHSDRVEHLELCADFDIIDLVETPVPWCGCEPESELSWVRTSKRSYFI
ncbi:hypothetical protein C8R47DRAFT_1128400 [Mycena vitilis]|nr:hypothetical protein C8R47DRAFT_1128400 [Mycena vitilis]